MEILFTVVLGVCVVAQIFLLVFRNKIPDYIRNPLLSTVMGILVLNEIYAYVISLRIRYLVFAIIFAGLSIAWFTVYVKEHKKYFPN